MPSNYVELLPNLANIAHVDRLCPTDADELARPTADLLMLVIARRWSL